MYIKKNIFSFSCEDSKDIIKNRELEFGPETNIIRLCLPGPSFRGDFAPTLTKFPNITFLN